MRRMLSISSASSSTLHKWTETNLWQKGCRSVVFHPAHYRTWYDTDTMTVKRNQSIQYTSTNPVSSAKKGSYVFIKRPIKTSNSNHKHADIRHHEQHSIVLKYRYWSCGWLYVIISSPSLPKNA
ncbi:hypothetical protein J3E68DRAFT_316316 [Trichoderma sp. SZMC 28012]